MTCAHCVTHTGVVPCPNCRAMVCTSCYTAYMAGSRACPTGQGAYAPRVPSPTEEYNAAERGGGTGEPKALACEVCAGASGRGGTLVGKTWRCWDHLG
jgi:hypothetical protein